MGWSKKKIRQNAENKETLHLTENIDLFQEPKEIIANKVTATVKCFNVTSSYDFRRLEEFYIEPIAKLTWQVNNVTW